jgi:predicted SAM-dependent methyltransferase
VKLNLGCYDKQLPGFVNVDIREDANPDVVDDAFKLKTFKEETVELIYSSHMLEHLSYKDCKEALRRWYKVLLPGGVLRLAVPDFDALCRRYVYTGKIDEVLHSVCGSQKHDFDFHMNIFNKERLSDLLLSAGFSGVRNWNWWETPPHNYCDDFSQSYLPSNSPDIALSHGRLIKNGGQLVSLNLEAVK